MMESQTSRQGGRRVLMVDDDPEVIEILETNLKHANFEVISARKGVQALIKASRERPDLILLDVMLPDLDGLDVCRRLKERQQTSHIPVIIISAKVENEDRIASIAAGAEDYITKPFDPSEIVTLVEASLKRVEQHKYVNRLTGLPDRTQIDKELTTRIKQNKLFAAIYVDIDSLKIFNNVYGYSQGDHAIRLVAEILGETVRLFGNPDDLVGHIGGDDFAVISTPQKASIICQRIITDFDNRIRTLYHQKDLERGYIKYESRLGQRERCPIMTLSAAVINNERRPFDSHLQVSEVATELRNYLRHLPGSNYYLDRREDVHKAQFSLEVKGVPGMPSVHQEELKVMQGMLAWVAFLTKELETPIAVIKDWLDSLPRNRVGKFASQQPDGLKPIQESISQLLHIMKELENLKRVDWTADSITLDEVDLRESLDWVIEQMQRLAEQQGVAVDIEGVNNSRLMVDGKSLTQSLFYLLRSEIESSAHGDRVLIRVPEPSETFITIEIVNRNRYIPPRANWQCFSGVS